jgi:hypothetical protein
MTGRVWPTKRTQGTFPTGKSTAAVVFEADEDANVLNTPRGRLAAYLEIAHT